MQGTQVVPRIAESKADKRRLQARRRTCFKAPIGRAKYGLKMLRRGRKGDHQALVDKLLERPDEWDRLRTPIREAADAARLSDRTRERLHGEVAREAWKAALKDGRLTSQDEERPSQIAAGLGLPADILASDSELLELAIVARANAGRFPTPVSSPRLPNRRSDEAVHMEFRAKLGEEIEVREFRGSAWGVSVPVGHGLSYTAILGGAKERTRMQKKITDSGAMSITSTRIVYWSPSRAFECRYDDLLELRRLPHSLVLLSTKLPTAVEVIVPLPDAIAAVINLQTNLHRGR